MKSFICSKSDHQMTGVERVLAYSHLPQETTTDSKRVSSEWPRTGSIHYNQVELRYDEDSPSVLEDISFRIEGGQRVRNFKLFM